MIRMISLFVLAAALSTVCGQALAQEQILKEGPASQKTAKPDPSDIPSPEEMKNNAIKLEENPAWYTDLNAVLAMEDKNGKDLFIYFNASDWGQWNHVLNKDIFQKQEFIDKMQEDYILINLDRPRYFTPDNLDHVVEIMEKYKILTWPTVVLANEDGEAYARATFMRGEDDPNVYVEHYKALKKISRELAAAIEGVKSADEDGVESAYIKLMDTLQACDDQGLQFKRCFSNEFPNVNLLLHRAFKEDPDNERGLMLKTAKFLLTWRDITEPVCMAMMKVDPLNEKGELEHLLETQIRESDLRVPEGGREIFKAIKSFYMERTVKDRDRDLWIKFIAGYINYRVLKDNAEAKAWLEKAVEHRCTIPRVTATAWGYLREIREMEKKDPESMKSAREKDRQAREAEKRAKESKK